MNHPHTSMKKMEPRILEKDDRGLFLIPDVDLQKVWDVRALTSLHSIRSQSHVNSSHVRTTKIRSPMELHLSYPHSSSADFRHRSSRVSTRDRGKGFPLLVRLI
ncbi:hypothetical protein JAAARDRAFT_441113 [Jaapia argillacea MUCL 33604]|uniref:Uncharacterized protein n=1 Tax=Jaapia argillacea MUCL 33604 TaxID=933084 RepID=A0A067PRN7_9AGAM|nr:hypothetical protein JAAARDRAFT_441113 [Jaapia argillacea MUCL 33604]